VKNARFWVWWNDGLVKLTLKPGQELRCWRSERHEEGWSSSLVEWEHTGEELLCRIIEDGTDCDGRVSYESYHSCPVGSLATRWNRFYRVWLPSWKLEGSAINDRFARSMNY